MILTLIGAIALYIIGFLLGRKCGMDTFTQGVYGVMSKINKFDKHVDSITYYYSKEAYQEELQQIKDLGMEYIAGEYYDE